MVGGAAHGLVEYRAAGHDWPRHKIFVEGLEHDLGVWLHYQWAKLHRGELDEARAQELDRVLPGWRTGRQREENLRRVSTHIHDSLDTVGRPCRYPPKWGVCSQVASAFHRVLVTHWPCP